jgi:outer membrane lipoprotein SlyB
VELIVRRVGRGELYLDMESINVNGQRYGVDATKRSIEAGTHTDSTIGANRETAEHVGGGALIGSVIGAIVGGGKGAAIGAAAGAGVGAATQIQVHGDFVSVPAESLITFRLESPLTLGWTDTGRDRDGAHYHGDNQR